MQTLEEQIASYASYHRNAWNKLSHFLGVPIVIFSIFIPMGWFRFAHADVPLSSATFFLLAVTLYYMKLDWGLALVQAPFSFALLYLAEQVSVLPFRESLNYFFVSFALGWTIQFIGHVAESKRPAMADNFWQIFNAPLFLAVELLTLLGLSKHSRKKIQE